MSISSYKDLIVWQKSIDLSVDVYKLTTHFPKEEIYGLTSQIRRCGSSIPANIAEGQSRGYRAEYAQFLRIAFGSAAELSTHLLIAYKIGLMSKNEYIVFDDKVNEIMKMLNRLIKIISQPISTS